MPTVQIPCHIQFDYLANPDTGIDHPTNVKIIMPDLDEVPIAEADSIPALVWVSGGWLFAAKEVNA